LSDNVTDITGVKSHMGIVALPNPFSDLLKLQFHSDIPGKAIIQFIGQDGRLIQKFTENVLQGDNILQFNTTSWQEGMVVCTTIMNGSICQQKLMKIK